MTSSNAKNMRPPARGKRSLFAACVAAALFTGVACMPGYTANGTNNQTARIKAGKQTGKPVARAQDPYAKEVTKRGNIVLVSREFAAAVKKDSSVLLSTVAIKARVDKAGQLTGYRLVAIDRDSAVSRMGFKAGDVVTAVNGIPARRFEPNRPSLESAGRFDVDFIRKKEQRRLNVEIQ
jgi:type II secretory pathway component PulC